MGTNCHIFNNILRWLSRRCKSKTLKKLSPKKRIQFLPKLVAIHLQLARLSPSLHLNRRNTTSNKHHNLSVKHWRHFQIKNEYLACLIRDVNVIVIQETHTSSDVNLYQRGEMPSYRFIGAIHSISLAYCHVTYRDHTNHVHVH
jgi:hypothetical protein